MTEYGKGSSGGTPDFSANPELQASDLLTLAAALRDEVNMRLFSPEQEMPTTDLERIFDEAMKEVTERMITVQLEQLSPVAFAELYARIHGNTAFARQLDHWNALQTENLTRDVNLQHLIHEGHTTGKLQLANVQQENVLVIGLFDAELPSLAAKRYVDNADKRPLHRLLKVRVIAPQDGHVQILQDSWVGPIWAEETRTSLATAHSRGRLGSRITDDKETLFEPYLSLHTPLTFTVGDQAFTPPQIIGYIETLDHTLLLDG